MAEAALHALQSERFVLGESVSKFEEEFAQYCGSKYGVGTSSGTAALTLSLLAIEINRGEIITSPASFVASANAVIHAGGTPKFADVELRTNTIDPIRVKEATNQNTKAIMPVHLYGFPAAMDRLCAFADERGLDIVEDACQAHGATFDGRKVGSFGKVGCFSFYPSKNMTVGGDGGMVVTDIESVAETIRSLRDSGRTKGSKYDHVRLGFTERMNTVQAAIGRVQLRHLDSWNNRRRQIAQSYNDLLSDLEDIRVPESGDSRVNPVYHMYVVRTPHRDRLLKWLGDAGIECGVHYPTPIHLQPVYRDLFGFRGGEYIESERLCKEVLSLPMHPSLDDTSIRYVSDEIHRFYEKAGPMR
jgi:perosamine synthetase